jgi:hypothetical protein
MMITKEVMRKMALKTMKASTQKTMGMMMTVKKVKTMKIVMAKTPLIDT